MCRSLLPVLAFACHSLPAQVEFIEARLDTSYFATAVRPEQRPRWWPDGKAEPLGLLREEPSHRGSRFLDLLATQVSAALPTADRLKLRWEVGELVLSAAGVTEAELRECGAAVLDTWIPRIELTVGFLRPVAGARHTVVPAGELERHAFGLLPDQDAVGCGVGVHRVFSFEAGAGRARILVEPHLLMAGPRIALLVEFECQSEDADGRRHWCSGVASGIVAEEEVLLLHLRDRVVAIGASHRPARVSRLRTSHWLLATSRSRFVGRLSGRLDDAVAAHLGLSRSDSFGFEAAFQSREGEFLANRAAGTFLDAQQHCLLAGGDPEGLDVLEPEMHAQVEKWLQPYLGERVLEIGDSAVVIPVLSFGEHVVTEASGPTKGELERASITTLAWRRGGEKLSDRAEVREVTLHGEGLAESKGEVRVLDAAELAESGPTELIPAAPGASRVGLRPR